MSDERELYTNSADFRRYVDAIAKKRELSAEEVLQFEVVRSKAEDIRAHDMERR